MHFGHAHFAEFLRQVSMELFILKVPAKQNETVLCDFPKIIPFSKLYSPVTIRFGGKKKQRCIQELQEMQLVHFVGRGLRTLLCFYLFVCGDLCKSPCCVPC